MILRNFTRDLLKMTANRAWSRLVDYAVCVDIESTCDSPVQIYPMELIEVACLKLDLTDTSKSSPLTSKKSLVYKESNFHSFVKPQINPQLTLFCQELTGITQCVVDKAPKPDDMIYNLLEWMVRQELIQQDYTVRENFAFVSCGNFDLNLLSPIVKSTHFKNTELPIYFREWINIKKTFVNHKKEWPKGLYHMMEILGVEPSGRLHSAKDDCENLAKVVKCLRAEGCEIRITSSLTRIQ